MSTGRRKLLLADDSPTIQKVVSLTFADEGMEVLTVPDGAQALKILEGREPPDILLADAVMPGPDGYELCRRVKTDARLRRIPVVLLVGTFEPFNEAEARRVGADTVLTKPFQSIRGLVNKVSSLLGGGEHRQEQEEVAAPAARQEQRPVRDRQADQPAASHADARAEAGEQTAGEPSAAHGGMAQQDPSASFADLGNDDELIEAKPADSFAATAEHARKADASADFDEASAAPFVRESVGEPPAGYDTQRPQASEARPASSAESFADLNPPAHSFSDMIAAQSSEARPEPSFDSSFEPRAESPFAAQERGIGAAAGASAQGSFSAQASGAAAADDALLDLGQVETPASAAAAEADDFILDLEDELPPPPSSQEMRGGEPIGFAEPSDVLSHADSAGAFAEAAHGETTTQSAHDFSYAPSRFEERSESEGGAVLDTEVVAQEEPASPYAEGRQGFIEPTVVPAEAPMPAVFESEFTDGSVEGDVPKPPAAGFSASAEAAGHTSAAPEAGAPVEPSTEGYAVGEARAGLNESLRAEHLSPEAVDAIARRVVELMSERVVREIAWEVVPDLAELLIKRKLEEEERRR